MREEIWKPVHIRAGYEVSNLGNVRSLDRVTWYRQKNGVIKYNSWKGQPLKKFINKAGYEQVKLGNYKAYTVHTLVLTAFIKKPSDIHVVNHINFNRSDNKLENLEWVTTQENASHSARAGRFPRTFGKRHPRCAVSEKMVSDIRKQDFSKFGSMKSYAIKNGLTLPFVSTVFNYKERING